MDWGFNAPGVVLWWAHVGDGHWHIVRELKFQHETADTVAQRWKGVMQELGIKKVSYVAADPSMWAKTGHGRGESIAETLIRQGLPMLRGDNDRKNGWQRCHELLRLAPDGRPWVTVDRTCVYGLRSLPAQVSDKKDPDDVNTSGDDHWVDAWRYGAMSRFVAGTRRAQAAPAQPWSLKWLSQQHQKPTGILGRRSA
jgi:hypothetical protein